MVGLPARGKTYTARKIARYLSWLGHRTRVFNVGAYRRERLGSQHPHSWFDPENPEGTAARLEVATTALDDMVAYLRSDGEVALYDATNTTRERRRVVLEECDRNGIDTLFVESICDVEEVIEANVRATKLHSPDYAGMDPDEAVQDFRSRIAHYDRVYEPVDESEGSFIKIIDVGRKLIAHRIEGYLPARVLYFLIHLHIQPRTIWLTRHGESQYNVAGRIGGDSPLSINGVAYSKTLARFVAERVGDGPPRPVWTSTLRRTIETADAIGGFHHAWKALDEIDAGVCDGMTYDEIARAMPGEFAARKADKFRYRYPRGESYQDVIQRLEPVIMALEHERQPIWIVGHQAVLRALYAYLMDMPADQCTRVSIPLHTVIRLTPTAYGCVEKRFPLAPEPYDREGFREGEGEVAAS